MMKAVSVGLRVRMLAVVSAGATHRERLLTVSA